MTSAVSPIITPDAIKRLLMQGGNPSAMFSGDPSQQPPSGPAPVPADPNKPPMATAGLYPPTPTASAPPPSAPPSGSISSAAQGSAPPSGTVAQNMSPQSSAQPLPSFATPEEKEQYLSEHPVAQPARPRGDFDKIPDGQPGADTWSNRHNVLRHVLASLFTGAAEFGGDMNHHPGTAEPFINRWAAQSDAQRNYDQNQPVLKQNAENQQYNQYLEQGAKAGEIEHTGAETANLQQNNPAMARKAQFLTQLQGDAESGKYDPAALKAKYLRMAQFNRVNVSPDEIDQTISGTKPLGSKYTLTRDPQTQAPIELVDRQDNHYSASNLPKDPEAQQMWNDAQTASGQKEKVEEDKEKRVAGYAADRQAQAFSNQQTEQGKKAASTSFADINDAKNQQSMIENLLGGKMNPTSQTAAMFKMIGLEQPTGAHRIMPAEIEGIEQQGGLTDRLKQKLLNWKEGDRFDPDLIPDVISTAKTLSQNKIKTANDNLESTARIYGYKAPGSDAKGRFDKPEDYAQPQQQGGQQKTAPPQGATHIGVSSIHGKKYYTSTLRGKNGHPMPK